jgi:dTDP-4-amino-4,6-dideoxygalactose transaminase
LVQLRKCTLMMETRRTIAERYSDAFALEEALLTPTVRPDRETSWHLYILRLRLDKLHQGRDNFIQGLHRRGVACSVHFIPLHLQPYYQRAYGYRPGDFPQAEMEYRSCLSLPIYPDLTDQMVGRVITSVRDTVAEFRVSRSSVANASAIS